MNQTGLIVNRTMDMASVSELFATVRGLSEEAVREKLVACWNGLSGEHRECSDLVLSAMEVSLQDGDVWMHLGDGIAKILDSL